MFKFLSTAVFAAVAAIFCVTSSGQLEAATNKRSSYITTKKAPKTSYKKKAPYEGYGKKSSVNGMPKTKIVNGHVKQTSKGYTYVNPYAKSR